MINLFFCPPSPSRHSGWSSGQRTIDPDELPQPPLTSAPLNGVSEVSSPQPGPFSSGVCDPHSPGYRQESQCTGRRGIFFS